MAGKAKSTKRVPKYKEVEQSEGSTSPRDTIRFLDVKLTDKQKKLHEIIIKNRITLIEGAAGTSKTFSAAYSALQLLKDGKVDKIVVTKSLEKVGGVDNLGFLKGDLETKLSVFLESFINVFSDIIDGPTIKRLFDSKIIEFKPIDFYRGITMKRTALIVDESQSLDIKTLMTVITRLSNESKFIFIMDKSQNDIAQKYVAVEIFKEILDGIKGVGMFKFERTDIMRDPILIEIIDRYEKIKEAGRLTATHNGT